MMSEPRNRVVQVSRYGEPGELEVGVLASGIEYTDVVIRRHLYAQTMCQRPPFVMGYDRVREIDQLGEGVSGIQLGDRVADMTVVGSNAAYRTLQAKHLARVATGVDAAEGAALILSWTTAYQLLHRTARVPQAPQALVQGDAAAVGQALLVLGKIAGLELWGTRRAEHAALIRELGATPIDYHREDCTRVPPGSRRTWSASSTCWQRTPFGRGSPSVFRSIGSQTRIAAFRPAVSMARSSCARTLRRDRTGSSHSARWAPRPARPRPRPRSEIQEARHAARCFAHER